MGGGVQVKDKLFYVKFLTVGYHFNGSLVGVSLLVAGKGFLGAELGENFDRGRAAKDLIVNSRGLNKGSSLMELEVSIVVGLGLSGVWV
jgi:hypothetical protein